MTDIFISKYAVGILDQVFVYSCSIISIIFVIIFSVIIIFVLSDFPDNTKWTPYYFFLKQKYMKFIWKDNCIFLYHELENDEGHMSTLEELATNFNLKFYYEKENSITEDISINELKQIEHLITPLCAKINFSDDNIVNIYFSKAEKTLFN